MVDTGTDPRLLQTGAHSASYFALARSTGEPVIDFCIPCNPYYPTPAMFDVLRDQLETILKYYPSDADSTTRTLIKTLGLHPQTVAMANGSTELITWIDHLLVKESVAIPIPTFGRWTDQPLETGKRVDMFMLPEADDFRLDLEAYQRFIRHRGSRVAVVCNPNNPDGGYLPRRDLVQFVDSLHDLDLVVVDESFIDFVDAEQFPSLSADAAIRPNLVVLKSLGKNFGLHGIRFGYLVANPALVTTIGRALPKWNINSMAEAVVHMLADHRAEYAESLRLLNRDRRWMLDALSQLPDFTVFPSQGNFLLVKLPPQWNGAALRDYLVAEHRIYVRECGNKLGMSSQFLRLVVRPRQQVEQLLEGLLEYGERVAGPPESYGRAPEPGYGRRPSAPPGGPRRGGDEYPTGSNVIAYPRRAAGADYGYGTRAAR